MKYPLLIAVATCLMAGSTAHAAVIQSPAYKECSELARTNPAMALVRAEEWARIDTGVAAQHCRAMALYGLGRNEEAATTLTQLRDGMPREEVAERTLLTQQAAQAWRNANRTDAALATLTTQITDMSSVRGQNVLVAQHTSSLLLERARLLATYGKAGDAMKDLDHAISLTPLNEAVLLERALVFEQLGDIALAEEDIKSALRLNPGNTQARLAQDRLKKAAPPAR